MKKNVFRNMLAFAMAAAISVGFTSCSSDDDVYAITDNNDDEWLVRFVNGIHCFYDEDNKLTSIIDDYDDTYYVTADGTLTIDFAEKSGSCKAQITLDDDNNITKIEYSEFRYDNMKREETYDFTYNDERLLSYAATYKEENLNKNNQNSWTTSTTRIGATFTWANENLSTWTVTNNTVTDYVNAKSTTTNTKDTYTYAYSGLVNPCKQNPYLIGRSFGVLNTDLSGIFSVLGLFGYGSKELPFSCKITSEYTYGTNSPSTSTSNYTYAFALNDNGTLNSETRYSEGSANGTTYPYVYTPTRAGSTGKHSLKELIRNMRPRDSFERNEQEQ